ncbi:MAG: chitobiase/beta-hexosaminidase C-terminal domain-containing protein, partial [Myxococcales bacterium]
GVRSQDSLDHAGQFLAPTVSNGAVYIPGGVVLDGTIRTVVAVYGLFSVPPPAISPADGTSFPGTQAVTITDAAAGAIIYYTTDGTDPTLYLKTDPSQPALSTAQVYTGPFTITHTTLVKARAYVGTQASDVTGAQLTSSLCDSTCNGCCQNNTCVPATTQTCGAHGSACTSCDPDRANTCRADGTCGCQGGNVCAVGQQCQGIFGCVCNQTSCPTGCCAGGEPGGYNATCMPISVNACGPAGSACVACDPTTADNCRNGGCACGENAPCSGGLQCISGQCGQALPPAYEGYFDAARCDVVFGWAWDRNHSGTHIKVNVYADGTLHDELKDLSAEFFRQDLVDHGIGDGNYGWGTGTPTFLKDGEEHLLDARFSGTTTSLGTSPQTLLCGPKIAWIQTAEDAGFGPSGTLTVAGYAYGGSGNVTLVWRDTTAGGAWNVVDYQAPVENGVWYNTIDPAPLNHCHAYEAYAVYDGGQSKVFGYDGSRSDACGVDIVWMQPQTSAGFGPESSIIVAGSARGVPGGQVHLLYTDLLANSGWIELDFAPIPDADGIWYNAFPADFTRPYAAMAVYDNVQSGVCVYTGNGAIVWCE